MEYRQRVALVDDSSGNGAASAEFVAMPARTGRYRVAMAFASGPNRATNVPVTIVHADGVASLQVDQRRKRTPFAFVPIGEYRFVSGVQARVTISNKNANGYVSVDAIRWVWIGN